MKRNKNPSAEKTDKRCNPYGKRAGATIAQQPVYAPLLAEAAAVLGLRAFLYTRLWFDSILFFDNIVGCGRRSGTPRGYSAGPDSARKGEDLNGAAGTRRA